MKLRFQTYYYFPYDFVYILKKILFFRVYASAASTADGRLIITGGVGENGILAKKKLKITLWEMENTCIFSVQDTFEVVQMVEVEVEVDDDETKMEWQWKVERDKARR